MVPRQELRATAANGRASSHGQKFKVRTRRRSRPAAWRKNRRGSRRFALDTGQGMTGKQTPANPLLVLPNSCIPDFALSVFQRIHSKLPAPDCTLRLGFSDTILYVNNEGTVLQPTSPELTERKFSFLLQSVADCLALSFAINVSHTVLLSQSVLN